MCALNRIVAADLGGTTITVAVIVMGDYPWVEWKTEVPTPHCSDEHFIAQRLIELLQEALAQTSVESVACIGICSTGVINHVSGRVIRSVNLPLTDYPLQDVITENLHLPVIVENDAKASALGEFMFGVGARNTWQMMVHIIVGTGIGGAIIYDGAILRGKLNLAGEFGHMCIDPSGPQCRCGLTGCVDCYASGYAIVEFVQSQVNSGIVSRLTTYEHIGIPQIIACARGGDYLATLALHRAGEALGILIANLANALNPDAFVLNGGVLNAGDLLWNSLSHQAESRSSPIGHAPTHVCRGSLGNNSGLFGIAELAYNRISGTNGGVSV